MDFVPEKYLNYKNNKIPLTQKIITALFLISIIIQPPFIFFSLVPNYKLIGGFCLLVLGFLFLLKPTIKLPNKYKQYFIFYVLIQIIYHFFLLFNRANQSAAISSIISIIVFTLYFTVFVNLCKKVDFIELYVKLISTFTAINIFGYFLLLFGLISPLYEFESKFQFDSDLFWNYGFLVIQQKLLYKFGSFNFARNCGYFDEPGTFAFYIILALLAYKLFLSHKAKNKYTETILVIGGCTTFSLAFYICLFFYVTIKLYENLPRKSSNKNKIKLKQVAIFCLLIIVFFAIFSNSKFYDFFNQVILSRLQFTGDGQIIAGNNRYGSFIEGSKLFAQHIWFGWGPGAKDILWGNFDSSSAMGALVLYGIVGTLIRYWQLFFIVYKSFTKLNLQFFIFGIVLCLNFLQRQHNFYDPLNLLYLFFIMEYFNCDRVNSAMKYKHKLSNI